MRYVTIDNLPVCGKIILAILKMAGLESFFKFIIKYRCDSSKSIKDNEKAFVVGLSVFEAAEYFRCSSFPFLDDYCYTEQYKIVLFSCYLNNYTQYSLDKFISDMDRNTKNFNKSSEELVSEFVTFCKEIVDFYIKKDFSKLDGEFACVHNLYKKANRFVDYFINDEEGVFVDPPVKKQQGNKTQNKKDFIDHVFDVATALFSDNEESQKIQSISDTLERLWVKYSAGNITYLEWISNIWAESALLDKEGIIKLAKEYGFIHNRDETTGIVLLFNAFSREFIQIRREYLNSDDNLVKQTMLNFTKSILFICNSNNIQYDQRIKNLMREFISGYPKAYYNSRSSFTDKTRNDILQTIEGFEQAVRVAVRE